MSDIWNETVIDGHPVVPKFIPVSAQMEPLGDLLTKGWKAKHVCQSKGMLQKVKYDPKCSMSFCTILSPSPNEVAASIATSLVGSGISDKPNNIIKTMSKIKPNE